MFKKVILLFFALSLFPINGVFSMGDDHQEKKTISVQHYSGPSPDVEIDIRPSIPSKIQPLNSEITPLVLTPAKIRSLSLDTWFINCHVVGPCCLVIFCIGGTILLWNFFH